MSGTLGIKVARIAIVLAVFALWETLSRTGIVNPGCFPRHPRPSQCLASCCSAPAYETILW